MAEKRVVESLFGCDLNLERGVGKAFSHHAYEFNDILGHTRFTLGKAVQFEFCDVSAAWAKPKDFTELTLLLQGFAGQNPEEFQKST